MSDEWELRYEKILECRKNLEVPRGYENDYVTLESVGLGDDWITPPQQTSHSQTGLVLVGKHFLDARTLGGEGVRERILENGGYHPDVPFRDVLEDALARADARLGLADVYVTQALHFLPKCKRSAEPRKGILSLSFDAVTRKELRGRTVVTLGDTAALACRRAGVQYTYARHPRYRRGDPTADIAESIKRALDILHDGRK